MHAKKKKRKSKREQSFLSLVPGRKEAVGIRDGTTSAGQKEKTFNGRVVDRKRKKRGVVRAAATL